MAIFATILVLGAGLILMAKGGDIFVDSATRIASLAKVPEFLIGATVVAVGTTLPELLTSLTAIVKGVSAGGNMQDLTDVAVGNAVGSMACNIGLILSVSFLLRPYPAGGKAFAVKGIFLLLCTGLLCMFCFFGGVISAAEGAVLIALFFVYIVINISDALFRAKKNAAQKILLVENVNFSAPAPHFSAERGQKKSALVAPFVLFALGGILVAAGALFTVESVCRLCSKLGIEERIISVTVVALGTSLPELVTAVTSARKGAGSLSLGNILGANVINGTLLLGLSACVAGGLVIDPITRNYTLFFTFAITAVLVLPILAFRRTSRAQALALLALYIAVVAINCIM